MHLCGDVPGEGVVVDGAQVCSFVHECGRMKNYGCAYGSYVCGGGEMIVMWY